MQKSYFIVSEAGRAWDISSHVLANIGRVGGTFFGKLVEHVTSCSLYQEKSSGWVTTLCPGSACNFAWGTSGGKKLSLATVKCVVRACSLKWRILALKLKITLLLSYLTICGHVLKSKL